MKKVYINEESLYLIGKKESVVVDEVTFYEFVTNIKKFLKDLLATPFEANVPDVFTRNGISKDKLISMMKELGIVKSKENITEVPIDEVKQWKKMAKKKRSKHTIQYLVPRARFNEKIKELYKILFNESVFKDEDELKRQILDSEDGEIYRKRGGIKERYENNKIN